MKITTIFCGTTFSENQSYRSLTSARSVTLTMTVMTGEEHWQYTSIAYEPEIGLLLAKWDLINWANKQGIALSNTWSCVFQRGLQCGTCPACQSRKNAFLKAGVADTTSYANIHGFSALVKRFMKRILRNMKLLMHKS